MKHQEVINKLPFSKPFLFVDNLIEINEAGVIGEYTFDANAEFYKGHFKDNPITPGVILTECCAQIGLVCLGIYLVSSAETDAFKIGMSSSEMEFYEAVFPNEKVRVTSEKVYFRFNKLKCNVKMHNSEGKLVCKGTISGMLKSVKNA